MCVSSCVVLEFLEKENDNVVTSSALELLKKMIVAAGTSHLVNQRITVVMLSQMPC